MRIRLIAAASTTALVCAAAPAVANTTFSDASGQYQVGVGPDGELYDSNTNIGLQNPAGADYISPGTPRDSWGITGSTGSAYADYEEFGTSNITGTTLTTGTTSATTISTTGTGLTVAQEFTFYNPNIVSIQETITNSTGADISGVVFRRDVDFDIFPSTFSENTFGPLGANPDVVASSYYGFENPDPAVPFAFPCTGGCNVNGDLGAGIDLGLGTLGAGDSVTFAFYYGINAPGQTLDGLFAEAQGEGLAYLIGTQSTENGNYPNLGAGSAILGVSLIGGEAGPPAVPEPMTWAMMLSGFGITGVTLRRRRMDLQAV